MTGHTRCGHCGGPLYAGGWGLARSRDLEVAVHHGCAGEWFTAQDRRAAADRARRNGATDQP